MQMDRRSEGGDWSGSLGYLVELVLDVALDGGEVALELAGDLLGGLLSL